MSGGGSLAGALAAILIALMLTSVLAAAAAAETNSTHEVTVSNSRPYAGELVTIMVSNAKDAQLVISPISPSPKNTTTKTFRYLTTGPVTLFKPTEPGLYGVLLVNASNISTILANASFEAIPGEWRLRAEKTAYQTGETVRITAQPGTASYSFTITFGNTTYRLLGESKSVIEFIPKEEGTYAITAYYQNETLAANLTTNFTVTAGKAAAKIRHNATNNLGDAINITINVTADNLADYALAIQTPSERYNYLSLGKTLSFMPAEEGNYTIELIRAGAVEDSVTIAITAAPAKEEKPAPVIETFALSQDVRLLLNFTELAKRHSSFLDRLFGRSPIAQVTAYVKGYENDPNFRTAMQPVEKDVFELRLFANPKIEAGRYAIILQTFIKETQVNQSYEFYWLGLETGAALLQLIEEEIDIYDFVNYSFAKGENATFILNLTDRLPFPRGLLDILLRRSRLDTLVLYVEGQENNSIFAPKADHTANDDFLITIPWNESIQSNVYKLVTIAVAGDSEHRTETIFNWGLTNKSLIVEKADALRKTATNETPHLPQPLPQPQTEIVVKSDFPASYTAQFINRSENGSNASIGELVITFATSAAHPVKSIVLHNFTLNVSFKEGALGIATGSVEAPKHAKPAKAYAIDPSFFTYESITITAMAAGEGELYACQSYNFSNKSCESWLYRKNLTAGEDYAINFSATAAIAFAEITAEKPAAAVAAAATTTAEEPTANERLLAFREQETRVLPGAQNPVEVFVITPASSNITDATLTETIPEGWSFASLPENSTVLNSRAFLLPLTQSATANRVTRINYATNAPAATALAAEFTSTVTSAEANTTSTSRTEVMVDGKNTPFTISARIFADGESKQQQQQRLQRRIATNITYKLSFAIRRLEAASVPNDPVIFTWPYNGSQLELKSVSRGCENQKTIQHSGIKALQCTWRSFKASETKEFTAEIKAVAEGIHSTQINATYDPPSIKVAVIKDSPYKVFLSAKEYKQGIIIEAWHNANATLPVSVSDGIKEKALISRETIPQNERASILIQDYKSEYFTITVGEETVSFGDYPLAIAPSPEINKAEAKAEAQQETGQFISLDFIGDIGSAIKKVVAAAAKKTFGLFKKIFRLSITGFAVKDADLANKTQTGAATENVTNEPVQQQQIQMAPTPEEQPQQQTPTLPETEPQPPKQATPRPEPEPEQQPRRQEFFATEPGKGSGDTPQPTPIPEPSPKPAPKAQKEWFPTYKPFTLLFENFAPPINETAIGERSISCERCDNFSAPPNTEAAITVKFHNFKNVTEANLTEYYPANWTLKDDGGGSASQHNETHNKIVWQIPSATGKIEKTYALTSPNSTKESYTFYSELADRSQKATEKSHKVFVNPFGLEVKSPSKQKMPVTRKIREVKAENDSDITIDLELKAESKKIGQLQIFLTNLTVAKNSTLAIGLDEVSQQKTEFAGKNFVKVYAVDASNMTFATGTLTAVAKGTTLLKCELWNFDTQQCTGIWKPILNLTPGEPYSIEINATDPAWAEEGLVAINTHKSIYLQGELAKIGIAVLDKQGRVVCDAFVRLIITSPSGAKTTLTTENGSIAVSDQCRILGLTNEPDYFTNYTVSELGSYEMNLTAITHDGEPFMLSNFTVQQNVSFDVERIGPTRIYPLVAYNFSFIIAANENFDGNITEIVPLTFAIPRTDAMVIAQDSDKLIVWNVSLAKGNTYNFSYEFDAPDISPFRYELGPLTIGNFTEARQWQVASDVIDAGANQILNSSEGAGLGACLQSTSVAANISVVSGTAVVLAMAIRTTDRVENDQRIDFRNISTATWTALTATSRPLRTNADTSLVNANALTSAEAVIPPNCGITAGGAYVDGIETENAAAAWLQTRVENGDRTESHFAIIDDGTLTKNTSFEFRWFDVDAGVELFIGARRVEYILDVIRPNNAIISPLPNANLSGLFLVNASVNDSQSTVNNVNLSLLKPGSIAAGPIAMKLGVGNLTSGYFNVTFNSTTVSDGFYNLSVNATDSARNTNISANVSITIDNTKANTSIASPVNGTQVNGAININASVNDTPSKVFSVAFRLIDRSTSSAWSSATLNLGTIGQGYWNATIDTAPFSNGFYNITINATDFSGNQQILNISQVIISREDTASPTVSIVGPAANANISGSFLANASVNDSGDGVAKVNLTLYNSTGNATGLILMSLGAGTNATGFWNATFDSTALRDGFYNLSVNATDSARNTNISANVSIIIDNTAVNVTAVAPLNNTIQNGTILINASVNDSLSRVFNASFRLTTASGSTVTSWLFATLGSGSIGQGYWNATFDSTTAANGNYNITINATDFAGNQLMINISEVNITNPVDNTPKANWSVQNGTVTIRGSNHINATISKVAINNSFILFRQRAPNGNDAPEDSKFYAAFANSTQIRFNRFLSSTTAIDIDYYVVSSTEIYVQWNNATYTNAQNEKNVSISSVNPSRTVVIAEGNCDSTSQNDWHESFWTANVTNSTNVRLVRGGASVCDGTVAFFAISFNDSSTIQQGEIALVSGARATANLTTAASTGNAFLLFERRCGSTASDQQDCNVKGNLTNSTQLVFERTGNTGTATVRWYVISNSNFNVQRGETAAVTGATTSATLSPSVNMSSSISTISIRNSGADTTYSMSAWSSKIVSQTNLSIARNDTTLNNFISWQSVEFAPPPTQDSEAPNVTLNQPSDTETVNNDDITFNWTAIDNLASTLTCNLTINSTVNSSGISTANNTPTTTLVSNFNKGPYQWNVTCTDSSGNRNTSSTRTFTVTGNPDKESLIFKVFDNVLPRTITSGSGKGPLRSVFGVWNPNNEMRIITTLTDNYINPENDRVVGAFQNTLPDSGWSIANGDAVWSGSRNISSLNTSVYYYDFFVSSDLGTGAPWTLGVLNASVRDSDSFSSYKNYTFDLFRNPQTASTWILTEISTNNASYDYAASSLSTQSTTYYFRFGEFSCDSSVDTGACAATLTLNLPLGWDVTSCGESSTNTVCSDTQIKWEGLPMDGFSDNTCGMPPEYFGRQYSFTAVPPTYPDTNFSYINTTLHYCDGVPNTHDTVGEHLLRVVVDSSTPPSITFIEPNEGLANKNFSGITSPSSSHNASGGGTTTGLPPGSANAPLTGTEATTQEYVNMSTSNDTRWHTIITTSGRRVFQSFNFKVTESPNDINKLTLKHEGFATRRTTLTADDFHIFIYNHTSDAYNLIKDITASSTDVATTVEIREGFSNYISNADVWVLVEGDFLTAGGADSRADMHTDYMALEVTTMPAISGQQLINVTATDNDGVSSCTYRYENSSAIVTNFTGLNSTGSNYFSNTSNTAALSDATYTLRARCLDTASNQNNVTMAVKVSNAVPTVYLQSPLNNTNFTTNNNVTFVWNATSPAGGSLTCNLTVNNQVNQSSIVSDSNKNTSKTVNNFNDGYHFWSVACQSSSGAANTSQARNFTVDINYPTISLGTPAANSFSSSPNVTFTYTPYDALGIANCSMVINSAVNMTNTTIANNALNNFTVPNINQGNYSWRVNCTDLFSHTNTSAARNITIDPIKPTINLSAPPNGASLTNGTVQFNFTATDNLDTIMGCNLTVNSVILESNIAAANNTKQVRNQTLADGFKQWNATCWDDTGNTNTSATWNFTLTGPPSVALYSPANNTQIRGNPYNISFVYTPSDGDGIANCSLVINSAVNQTNTTAIINGANNSINLTNASEQKLDWTVSCYDLMGTQGNATARMLTIDNTPPFVNLTGPANNFTFSNGSVQLNFTSSDNYANNQTCNLTVNSIIEEQNFVVENNTLSKRNITLGSGVKLWNATCADFAGNSNTSQTRNFTVLGAPTVILQLPENNTVQKGTNLNFSYYADDLDPIANCTLVINNIINQTNTSKLAIPGTNSFLANLSQRSYNWTANCTDAFNNLGTADAPFIVTIDTTRPWFNLSAPANGTNITNTTTPFTDHNVQFNFTAFDNYNSTMTCNLTIDSTVPAAHTNFNTRNSTLNIRNQTGLAEGGHLWNASCFDNVGNFNTSQTYNFTLDFAPRVLLQSPANGTYTNSTRTFVYNVTDYNQIANCSLTLNGIINSTNTSVTNNANNSFLLQNMNEQKLEWAVQCFDSNGNRGNDTARVLYVDTTAPVVHAKQPNGSAFSSGNSIQFTINATDNNATSMPCSIYINSTAADNFTATKDQDTARTISIATTGYHIWNSTCTDNATNTGTSATLNFTITTAPVVTLLAPANDSADIDGNVTFFYNATDQNLANCSLLINDVVNRSNTTIVISGDTSNLTTASNFSQGSYNWTVNCVDATNFAGNATPFVLHVDSFAPYLINITAPANSSNVSTRNVTFNFTAFDAVDTILGCDLTINGTINQSSINATNGTATTVLVPNFNVGSYSWNVTCQDNANLTNTSRTFVFAINVLPTITLQAPVNNFNTSARSVNFSYVPESVFGIDNCQLFLDPMSNQTDIFVENGLTNYFNASSLNEGLHNWSIACDDTNTPAGSASTNPRNFTVDLKQPVVTLAGPNGTSYNYTTISFNFTVIDNFGTFSTCDLTVNGTTKASGIYAPNSTSVNTTASNYTDGLHMWNATCTDPAGNSNTSTSLNFTITEPPRLTTNSPAHLTRSNDSNQTFTFTPLDNSDSISSCAVILNGQLNLSNNSITAGQQNVIRVSNLSHNEYTWTVNCTDAAGNSFANESENKVLRIDKLGPGIDQNSPATGQVFNTEDITFNFTATEQFGLAPQLYCEIYLNGPLNRTVSPVTAGAANLTLVENLNIGRHNWSVSCIDDLGNRNTTGNVSFTVNAPDLTLNSTHIVFNNTNPDEGQNITVNATILNIGGNPATNATVQLFDNNGTNENQLSIQNVTIQPGQNVTVMANLTMTAAMHRVTVALDLDNLLVELDDTNNNASRNISILKATVSSPPNGTVQSAKNATVNSTVRNYRDADLNFTLFVDGKLNTTNLTHDGNYNLTVLNLTEGVHTATAQASEPDLLNSNQTFRSKNSTTLTITVDLTAPVVNITTANNTFFANATPTVFFNITDNLDPIINYTVYVNTAIEDANYTSNGTLANVTLSSRANGSYLITVEALDSAGNRINGTPAVIFVDTAFPSINISTANNTNFSDLTPEIIFNITDNLDSVLNYTIFVDGTKNDNGTRAQGQNTANLTTQTEGEHNITMEALDEAGNRINSTPIRIFIDATAPAITIDNPTPNDLEGFTISILTTITDGSGVGIANVTFTIVNDTSVVLESGALAAPEYDTTWDSTLDIDNSTHTYYVNLTVAANDTLGNSRNTTIRFIVDNRNPDITFVVPSQNDFNSSFNLSIQLENYNLTLSNYSIFNSTYQQQNNTNESIFQASFNWTDLVNLSNLTSYPEGLFNITAYAMDTLGNNRTASSYFRVDRTAPNITLETPLNSSNLTGTSLEFNFTAADNSDTSMTCNLTIDNSVAKQNFAAANATLTNATIAPSFQDGAHYWQVQCMDNAGNRNTTLARNFTYDTAPPTIALNTPANNTANNTRNVSFTYTPTDASTTVANCSILVNGTVNKTETSIQNSQANNFTVQNFNEGVYLWNVQCTDVVGNTNRSAYNFTLTLDLTSPAANITTANGTAFSAGQPNITINLTDNLASTLNYTMFVDNVKDDNGTATRGVAANATLTFHANGTYTVIAEATDQAGNRANSTPVNITIDTVKPTIELTAPANNTKINTTTVQFNFTAADNLANSFPCDLVIDNAANATRQVTTGISQNISVSNFTAGIHMWNVSCTDNAGNANTSTAFYFNMTRPDLVITSANITFNTSQFEEGKSLTIYANVHNIGEAEAQNVLVEIFNGSPSLGLQLYNATIALIQQGANQTVNTTAAFAIGTHTIYARVDSQGRISESNESNNEANRSFTIPLWNYVYGSVTGEYQLRNDSLSVLYEWAATANSTGNIYATDYDSTVSWANLTKLGTNKTGNFTITDFEELDTALNTTGYDDSINRTYTSQGQQRMNGTFTAFTKSLANVAIANSTNNTNFATGILWDASGDADGEYNGSADVAFITNISRSAQGAYGVYDYEIRIPATLRNYKGPDKAAVVFYMELR